MNSEQGFEIQEILRRYGLSETDALVTSIHSGLINHTWKISGSDQDFVLQKINTSVFKNPEHIDHNLRLLSSYLAEKHPGYLFVGPAKDLSATTLQEIRGEYYRVFPFIPNSHSIDVVRTPKQAYEAARHFGNFTKQFIDFDVSRLKPTIPNFHDLSLRYYQYEKALKDSTRTKNALCLEAMAIANDHAWIVTKFESIKASGKLKTRVTHHDTKISNILFDDDDNGLCVIDLDTVMPGYFVSDVGDMIRTYVCPVSEEEEDLDLIEIRPEFLEAIRAGYLSAMGEELNSDELNYLFHAGSVMIYMQALRFLTDHLNNDIYYGAAYPDHNLVRARNQLRLLTRYLDELNKTAIIN